MPEKNPRNFFQQLVHDRPDLNERLVYFHWFTNNYRREKGKPEKNIREVVYDMLEHTLNKWVLLEDEENHSLSETAKKEGEQ